MRGAIVTLLAAAVFGVDLSFAGSAGVAYVAPVVLAMWLPGVWSPAYVASTAALLTGLAYAVSGAAAGDWPIAVLTGLALLAAGVICSLRKRSHVALAAACQRSEILTAIADNVGMPIVGHDPGGRVCLWNPSAERLYGLSPRDLGRQRGAELFAEGERETVLGAFRRATQSREPITVKATRIGRHRRHIDVETTVVPLLGRAGEVLGVATIDRDLEPERQSEYAHHRLANFDHLTWLPNRQQFQQRLEEALELAARRGRSAALLFFDLDGFKHVNDALGHPAGDRLLCIVAERLMASVRRLDYVGRRAPTAPEMVISRFGGDEFTVILSEIASFDDASRVAKRMRDAIARPISLLDKPVNVSASVGIAVYPFDGQDAETLVRNADTAMYKAKTIGRGQCAFYSEDMNRELKRRLAVASCLRSALDSDLLDLHFQPVWTANGERLVGAEALVRLRDAELGPIAPDEFIPIAEETGLIVPLGRWVLRTACVAAAGWQRLARQPVWVSVNLSTHQLRLDDLATLVPQALSEAGLAPPLLELEITESAVLETERNTTSVLQRLRGEGVRIVLDDFGTGYSSLSRLRDLPLDGLKIDRSFLRENGDWALAKVIIAMAGVLGVKVIAEGVETERQLIFLRRQPCDQVQGFLLGRPVPEPHFVNLFVRPGAAASRKPELEP